MKLSFVNSEMGEIAKYFIQKGEKTAIISRGYGGKLNNKEVHVVSDGINLYHTAEEAGDEPYWLAVNLDGCAVLTCSSRYKAAKYAIENLGIKKIILDDGFQHRKLYRDLNIVLIDSEKMFGNENGFRTSLFVNCVKNKMESILILLNQRSTLVFERLIE